MASKVWLLVEWVDESNVFSSYSVVNCDSLAYHETDVQPGKVVFVRANYGNPRKAKILRISESKQYIKEYKEIMERQDQQFKNVLVLCVQTIQQMKAGNSDVRYDPQMVANQIAAPHVLIANKPDSGSDSDLEPAVPSNNLTQERSRLQSFNNRPSKYPQGSRKQAKIHPVRGLINTAQQRRPSMVSSTPLPSSGRQNVVLCFDQGSQTEEEHLKPPFNTVAEMEAVLSDLFQSFKCIVSHVNENSDEPLSLSDIEDEYPQYIKNIESSTKRNNTEEDLQSLEMSDHIRNVEAEDIVDENVLNLSLNISNGRDPFKVRRMPAHTTNNIETVPSIGTDLVPIGSGNAKVPGRLLHGIDWTSHTTATRQLLQAVFPRNVLATHCLSGKQSPAFMNRPAKKILDPKLVEDIVKIVSTRCGVPKNLVRNSITVKCTDEAKLYRNRQQYKQQRKNIVYNENIPSSDESSHILIH